MAGYFEPLIMAAVGVASKLKDHQQQMTFLDQSKTLAESALQMLYAAKEGGGNPKVRLFHPTLAGRSSNIKLSAGSHACCWCLTGITYPRCHSGGSPAHEGGGGRHDGDAERGRQWSGNGGRNGGVHRRGHGKSKSWMLYLVFGDTITHSCSLKPLFHQASSMSVSSVDPVFSCSPVLTKNGAHSDIMAWLSIQLWL